MEQKQIIKIATSLIPLPYVTHKKENLKLKSKKNYVYKP